MIIKAEGTRAGCEFSTAFITSPQFAGENAPGLLSFFKTQSFSCLIAKFKFNHAQLNLSAATSEAPFLVVFFFSFFVHAATAQRPPTVYCTLFVLTNEGSKLMWKDVLIIIHLPSNYTLGLLAINHFVLFFSVSLSLPLSVALFHFCSSPPCRSSSTRWSRSNHKGAASRQRQPRTEKMEKGRQLAASSLLVLFFLYVSHIECPRLYWTFCSDQMCFIVSV